MARAASSTRFHTSVDGGSKSLVPLTALIKVVGKSYASMRPLQACGSTGRGCSPLKRVSWAIAFSRKLPRAYPLLDAESLQARQIAMETSTAAWLEGGAGILQIRHKGH